MSGLFKSDKLMVSIGQSSLAGRKAENQDFHGILVPKEEMLDLKGIAVAVADGISSSAKSHIASETAVKSLLTDYYDTPETWSVLTAAKRVISATNAWLYSQNKHLDDFDKGLVCTLSALIIKGQYAYIFHIGDSRIQKLAGDSLEPLTRDHVKIVSTETVFLARSLGSAPDVEIDIARVPIKRGDIFLLTTDGVHDHIEPSDVIKALTLGNLDEATAYLTGRALASGSEDNLTAQLVRIDSLPSSDIGFSGDADDLKPPKLAAGNQIDGFTVRREIYCSARSRVYLASDQTGEDIVLKVPATDITEDRVARRRFELEEWIARKVSSPHVIRPVKRVLKRTALYTATEYVEGTTLRQWMTDHPKASPDQVRAIIDQLAKGLLAIHRRDMIHQDLRPENIMIDQYGTLKIIDLGSASVEAIEEAVPGILGPMAGTYQYTAPEYLSGDAVSWRSDQFSLGVIAYEMLTGRFPYGQQVSRISSRQDQQRLTYQNAHDETNAVPLWMDQALKKATHPDPLFRYEALSEFIEDLKRPRPGWNEGYAVPLATRNPVRFWQSVSAILAILCIILALRLGS